MTKNGDREAGEVCTVEAAHMMGTYSVDTQHVSGLDFSRIPCDGISSAGPFLWLSSSDSPGMLYAYNGMSVSAFRFENQPVFGRVSEGPKGAIFITSDQGLFHIQGLTNRGLAMTNRFKSGRMKLKSCLKYTAENAPLHDSEIINSSGWKGKLWMLCREGGRRSKRIAVFDGSDWSIMRPGAELPEAELWGPDGRIRHGNDGRLLLIGENSLWEQRNGDWFEERDFGRGSDQPLRLFDALVLFDSLYVASSSGVFARRNGAWSMLNSAHCRQLAAVGGEVWASAHQNGLLRLRDGLLLHKENSDLPDNEALGFALCPDGSHLPGQKLWMWIQQPLWILCPSGLAILRSGEIKAPTPASHWSTC